MERTIRKGVYIASEVIGYFETERLLVRSWKSRFQRHCCFAAGFDTGLARLVLGGRKRRGVCRLRSSFGWICVFDLSAPEASLKDWALEVVLLQVTL